MSQDPSSLPPTTDHEPATSQLRRSQYSSKRRPHKGKDGADKPVGSSASVIDHKTTKRTDRESGRANFASRADKNSTETPGHDIPNACAVPRNRGTTCKPCADASEGTQLGRTYGPTTLVNANAVLGDVVHNYNYYNGTAEQQLGMPRGEDVESIDPYAISDYDFSAEHWYRSQQRLTGTCEWITSTKEYQHWLAGAGPPILFCTGPVGCGKSVLAYWCYCRYSIHTSAIDKTARLELFSGCVRTFMDYHHRYCEQSVKAELKTAFGKGKLAPNAATITRLFTTLCRWMPGCIFVADGIDALQEKETIEFFKFLRESCGAQGHRTHALIFCRDTVGKGIRLENVQPSSMMRLTIAHLRHDIHFFVDYRVDMMQSEKPIPVPESAINHAKEVLKAHSKKMILWIQLQITCLWDPAIVTCEDDFERQLASLPEGLDEVYAQCLDRIDATTKDRSRDIAPRLFKWVAFAKQGLTETQARQAVSMTTHNLPLQVSAILSCPVTDYCANLVVVDEITGLVAFPHRTVREFLSDPTKIPAHLRHFQLCGLDDDLWIGKLCLAYAKVHHERKQVVVYQTRAVNPNITAPIMRAVFGKMLPFRQSRIEPETKKTFQMPMPSSARQQGLTGKDFSLHYYLCKHWLSHNRHIEPEADNFPIFKELCLSHDHDLQPWTTDMTSGLNHYQRLVDFAVRSSHAPLLMVAVNHIQQSKPDLISPIFRELWSGTDSTILHTAAAVGNKQVIDILLPICAKNFADTQGGSAAAIAAMSHRDQIFPSLLSDSTIFSKAGSWTLSNIQRDRITEDLLSICFAFGNAKIARYMLKRLNAQQSLDQDYLSTVFFNTCKESNHETIHILIESGANPSVCVRFIGSFFPRKEFSSSVAEALGLGDLALMQNLLTYGAEIGVEEGYCNILDLMLRCKDDVELAGRLLTIMIPHSFSTDSFNHFWPDDWLQTMLSVASNMKHGVLSGQSAPLLLANRYFRLILLLVGQNPHQIGKLREKNKSSDHGPITDQWLKVTPDDLLLQVLKHRWISNGSLMWTFRLEILALRGTSRALETVINDAGPLRIARSSDGYGSDGGSYGLEGVLSSYAIAYTSMVTLNILKRSLDHGSRQAVEFILCYSPKDREHLERAYESGHLFPNNKIRLEDLKPLQLAIDACEASTSAHPILTRVRCYLLAKSDLHAAHRLCAQLAAVHSDGNPALNFPAGYTQVADEDVMKYGTRWITSRRVWLGVHGWNFKLNRRRGKQYSEADMRYMGLVCHMILENILKSQTERSSPLSYGRVRSLDDLLGMLTKRNVKRVSK